MEVFAPALAALLTFAPATPFSSVLSSSAQCVNHHNVVEGGHAALSAAVRCTPPPVEPGQSGPTAPEDANGPESATAPENGAAPEDPAGPESATAPEEATGPTGPREESSTDTGPQGVAAEPRPADPSSTSSVQALPPAGGVVAPPPGESTYAISCPEGTAGFGYTIRGDAGDRGNITVTRAVQLGAGDWRFTVNVPATGPGTATFEPWVKCAEIEQE